ncbi:MAG: hypothetical protein A2Z20_11685 [Bdellovibrionales bacterium RBG_16_40_8]|nr:MAG: hypothetical protein A2Z20_11685 [Bdellovibrionales bacterium RBG_16_40_8]
MHPLIHANKLRRYFLLTILSLSLACTKQPTNPDTFSLSGTVTLEGQIDHSGITVALYDLAELDTAVVRMQKEFPFAGVAISKTKFEHRKHSLLK